MMNYKRYRTEKTSIEDIKKMSLGSEYELLDGDEFSTYIVDSIVVDNVEKTGIVTFLLKEI